MARVLFMTLAAASHIHSRLGIARALRARGHHVGWLTQPRPDARLAKLGFEVHGIEKFFPPMARMVGAERIELIKDVQRERKLVRSWYIDLAQLIEPVRAVIREFRPDVIALDATYYFFVIAAQLEGVPWATVSSGLWLLQPPTLRYQLLEHAEALAPERDALFARFDMHPEFRLLECLSPALNLVATTRDFVGPTAEWPPHTHAIGPTITAEPRGDEVDFPWDRLAHDRPIVYLALGTGVYWLPDLIRAAAEACAELGAQLVASVIDLVDHDSMRGLPGDPIIAKYVPQLEVLARANAFITHGGAASVMEAIYRGIPQLVTPIATDAYVQAYFVAQSGAGLTLGLDRFTAAECRDQLAKLLAPDSSFRRRALELQTSYLAADGATRGAELIEKLLDTVPLPL